MIRYVSYSQSIDTTNISRYNTEPYYSKDSLEPELKPYVLMYRTHILETI